MSDTALATVPRKPNVQELMHRVQDRNLSFGARLTSVGEVMKATAHQMMAALPKHVTPDRMMRVALNAIRKNPKLLDCSAASLFGAITEAATYGWEIGGILGHAYLVPYADECVLIPGYKGLVDLCRRSGHISTISLEVVHAGDEFHYSLGDDPHIKHQPNDRDPKRDSKPITHVYAVVRLRDGGVQRSVWSKEKIDAHKEQYSQAWRRAEKGKKDSFWHTAWPAAAKKTVIRDMIQRGLLPMSPEYREIADRSLNNDDGDMEGLTFDVVPPERLESAGDVDGEVIDRPQTGEEVNETLAATVDADLAAVDSIGDCEAVKASWLRKVEGEADAAMVRGKCDAKAQAIRESRGEKSNKK